ncbi:TPA: HAMP domain-containing histidine kinase [Escherichia coli]|uniref:ATP-binding protein n=1 Tax=Escherichia coli TaxID=562 RepID=UPI000BE50E62|nr:ATP-binding protein [Escherichia coli]EBO7692795.1 sensor histidine kinase [Salmonella enterica]ECS2403344.1 sensor histidine kinase [Salmonella enterica subsp. enterica]EDP9544133.1 HAMP domain-containing histidine kinase [Salmonella enterica subsp. enterica serovar Saintpaul]EGI3096337.1 HAMP domain-containing histidine kinase [Escherichia coli]EJK1539563.1 HAMP domain-containing histidine kinase [Escherichia coli]
MNKETLLSRQILTHMLSLTFIIIAITVLGSYLFYTFLIDFLPGEMNAGHEDDMTFIDWMWILIASTTSLVVSLFFTIKLSIRILKPLNDVALSLKQISQGNLSARASGCSFQLGEMNHLVNDFNEMAEKLQTLDTQRNLWNAAIAHELRTPVTILRGRLQGLVDGVFEPEQALLRNLLKETEGLTNLIEDLRVVSSSGRAGYSLTLREVDLRAMISNAIDTFLPDFETKQRKIITKLKCQRCVCDPLRIIQCLNILFDNALKYSTSETLFVKNGVTGNYNFIIVQDEGPGIPEELQGALFQPFQRGKCAKQINPEGCGLGLSIVKAIMRAHGGNVSYRLTQENGSIFKLKWPVRRNTAHTQLSL